MTNDVKILRWNNYHAILLCFLFILYTVMPVRFPVVIAGTLSFLYYVLINFDKLKAIKPFAGYANRITMVRLILVIITGLFYKHMPGILLFIIGISIFCLDGLDGYLARNFNHKSDFGSYFDLETDAFYVCVFTIILYEKGLAGYWIIIPGFMRYFYSLIILLIGRKATEEIRTKFGPLIGGIFFVSILSPYILPEKFYFPILIISSVLLTLSFLFSLIQNLSVISD